MPRGDERTAELIGDRSSRGTVGLGNASFSIGQLVHHRLFDYRGVVFDVDPEFQLTDEWYEEVARSRPPRDRPWYHVLVDGSDQVTYVAERNLEPDDQSEPIDNPLIHELFGEFERGSYRPRRPAN